MKILSQSHYNIENMLKKFKYFGYKPIFVPYDQSLHLVKNIGGSVSQVEYACIISSLLYLMNCTRPNIAYAINRLSRYTHNPSYTYWSALIIILKCLSGTINMV